MEKICTLSSLCEGQLCSVRELLINGKMRSRLSDLGLIEGTQVLCLMKSFSGDPTAYLIRGAVIALRNDDASKIIVKPKDI